MNTNWTPNNRLFYPFACYLQERFGVRVAKIALDAGLTCPNRDGTKGVGGCVYCDNAAFNRGTRLAHRDPIEQLQQGMKFYRRRIGAERFIAYFQAYSNTYGDLRHLQSLWRSALEIPTVVGLSVGTRPDCVDEPVLDALSALTDTHEVWVEYGLQSAHDHTLERIKRGHTFAEFADAMYRTAQTPLKVCVHLIIGLPGESKHEMLETIHQVLQFQFHAIKIHVLHVVRGTPLEKDYEQGNLQLLDLAEYAEIVADYLERLPSDVAVMRLTGDAPPDLLVAPDWCRQKNMIAAAIEVELRRRGTHQGALAE